METVCVCVCVCVCVRVRAHACVHVCVCVKADQERCRKNGRNFHHFPGKSVACFQRSCSAELKLLERFSCFLSFPLLQFQYSVTALSHTRLNIKNRFSALSVKH